MRNSVPQGFWGPPYPVFGGYALPPFGSEDPIKNLPDGMNNTVREIQNCKNVSTELIVPCVLATMSLATQGHIDVVNPFEETSPVSLSLSTVAGSGVGKTSIDKSTSKPVVDLEEQRYRDYESRYTKYKAELILHEEKEKDLKKKVRRRLKEGKSTEDLEKEIDSLVRLAPVPPRRPKLLIEKATPEALISGLIEDIPYAGVFSSEGSNILRSGAFNTQGIQNSIWSGDSVHVSTKAGGDKILKDARLTTHIMSQPGVMEQFLSKKGCEIRDSGMLARFLFFFPESTQGFRQRWTESSCGDAYRTFYDRAYSLLEVMLDQFDNGIPEKVSVRFSDDAAAYWKHIANEVETNLAPGGRFESAPDHGSRIAENIARVAAIMCYFEKGAEQITTEEVGAALHIVLASSRNFMQYLVPEPQCVADGKTLYEWFRRKVCNQGYRFVRKRYIAQYGPNQLRGDQRRLDNALTVLGRDGSIVWNSAIQPEFVDTFPGLMDSERFQREVYSMPLGGRNAVAFAGP